MRSVWVWQTLNVYRHPSGQPAMTRKARENLRFGLVHALAECSIDGAVCPIGK